VEVKELKFNYYNKKKYIKISTGDLLRNEISSDSRLGKSIQQDMNSGNLIKDVIVNNLLDNELKKYKNGLIFDGYPRNIKQANTLTRLLNKNNLKIDAVIHLDTPDDLIIKRITGRYICKECGATYNKFGVQPKKKVYVIYVKELNLKLDRMIK